MLNPDVEMLLVRVETRRWPCRAVMRAGSWKMTRAVREKEGGH